MLQIDHIYEFFYHEVFNNFENWHLPSGVPKLINEVKQPHDINIFTLKEPPNKIIFFYDQEPIIENLLTPYLSHLLICNSIPCIIVTSEKSQTLNKICKQNNLHSLYYFFHGFAALDWYRGYYALNYNKSIVKKQKDFITFNRLITEDRSYRIYFISQLAKQNLLDKGLVSFGVSDDGQQWRDELERNNSSKLSDHARQEIWNTLPDFPERLIIDNEYCPGDSSSRIPFTIERIDVSNDTPDYSAFWHIVTETVFYYDKLHLTEKIFKPIVSKQPFMLLAAPGNLEYLRSYGFKTFEGIIDESYDKIEDNDARIDAVVAQMKWYSELSDHDKLDVMKKLEPVVEYNFHHFYGKFKEIITDELLTNCQKLFKDINYTTDVDFSTIRNILLN